jgi:hypothetical protein
MKILLIGPLPQGERTTGVQEFNRCLLRTLTELGHRVEVALPGRPSIFGAERNLTVETSCRVFSMPEAVPCTGFPSFFRSTGRDSLAQTLSRFDAVILSGSNLAYAELLCAACGTPCLVWTHGQQISPFGSGWEGKELALPGVQLVCINELHRQEAEARGYEDKAVMIDLPLSIAPQKVLSGKGFCVSVSNLEARKNYRRVMEITQALPNMPTQVFGSVVHAAIKKYGGRLQTIEVLRQSAARRTPGEGCRSVVRHLCCRDRRAAHGRAGIDGLGRADHRAGHSGLARVRQPGLQYLP